MTSSPRTRPRRRAGARLAASATAVTLVAGVGLGTAGSASAADPLQYTATTGSSVVGVVLTLPAAIPGLPNPSALSLLGTQGQARDVGGDTSQASSFLAGGSLVTDSPLSPALAPLSRTLTASLDTPGPLTANGLDVPANPLGLALTGAEQTASVVPASGANAATSQLADASLGSLRALGLGALLDPLFGGLNTALTTITTQAAPLTQGISMLPSLPSVPVPNPLQPVVGGPATIPTPTIGGSTVASTVNELPARIQALEKQLLDGAVLKLNGLDTGERIDPTTNKVVAAARAKLGTASLFGGLVTVTATAATATATAASPRSDAASDASATLVDVKVADTFGQLLSLVASEKGITAGLLGGTLGQTLDPTVRPVVATVDAALDTVLKQLTGLLGALGGGAQFIKQGTTTTTVSPDGRKAEAHASPALVSLGLPVAPNLLTLSIGNADATAALTAAPATVTPASAPVTEPSSGSLPRTGANGAAGLVAVLLSGAGLLAWRRRTA